MIRARRDQTIAFEAISDKIFGDSFTLNATASSELPVTYSVVSGPVSLSGATLFVEGVGVATIAANQEGNDDFSPAVQVIQSFEIFKADQVITIEAISDKRTTDDSFDVMASVDSDLELTYEINGPATIDGTTISLDGSIGTVTVIVSQAGNENYNEATQSLTFEVTEEEALAIKEDLHEIKFYPNPTVDFLYIESDRVVSIRLFDVHGKLIKQDLLSHGKLDLRNINQGLYLLEITIGEKTTRQRIVKAN